MGMLHQYLQDELCNNKSLGALTYLLGKGREFEFSYKGTLCFISRSETQKEVSIWVDKQEYAFDNIDDLAEEKIFILKMLLSNINSIISRNIQKYGIPCIRSRYLGNLFIIFFINIPPT